MINLGIVGGMGFTGLELLRVLRHHPQGRDTVVVTSALDNLATLDNLAKGAALATLDNLAKGAAGQAVQAMKVMFALPETMGLAAIALLAR